MARPFRASTRRVTLTCLASACAAATIAAAWAESPNTPQTLIAGTAALLAGVGAYLTNDEISVASIRQQISRAAPGITPPLSPRFQPVDRDISAVTNSLDTSLVTSVIGPTGCGKTQLAVYCANVFRNKVDLIWWIDASTSDSILSGLLALASDLELERTATAVLRWLESHQSWLLVLDDAKSSQDLNSIILSHVAGRYLVTSQASLDLGGVHHSIDPWSIADSVQFLNSGSASDDSDLAEIARRLGGVPAALDQARSYMTDARINPSSYLRLLEFGKKAMVPGLAYNRPESIADSIRLAVERAESQARGAQGILQLLCAYDAPSIPRSLPLALVSESHGGSSPSRSLKRILRDESDFNQVLGALVSTSLLRLGEESIALHASVRIFNEYPPRKQAHYVHYAADSIVRVLSPMMRDSSVRADLDLAQQLFPLVTAVLRRADELLPPEGTWARHNWPLWMAQRECASAYGGIAHIMHRDGAGFEIGYKASVSAIETLDRAIPWVRGFQLYDKNLTNTVVLNCLETAVFYAYQASEWARTAELAERTERFLAWLRAKDIVIRRIQNLLVLARAEAIRGLDQQAEAAVTKATGLLRQIKSESEAIYWLRACEHVATNFNR